MSENNFNQFLNKLRQILFVADPVSSEAKKIFLNAEDGYKIVDELSKSENKEKKSIKIILKDKSELELTTS